MNNLHSASNTIRQYENGTMEQWGARVAPHTFTGEIPEGWEYSEYTCPISDEFIREWNR